MNIKTKFDVGQVVYTLSDNSETLIESFITDIFIGRFGIWYYLEKVFRPRAEKEIFSTEFECSYKNFESLLK